MKFGAKEVMVIAALTFGVMAAGCSATCMTPVIEPPLGHINTELHECKICFSDYELELYDSSGLEALEEEKPSGEFSVAVVDAPVTGGAGTAGSDYYSEAMSWTLSLPGFFK